MSTFADAITTPSGIALNPLLGRQAAAASRSLALSNEDNTNLAAINTNTAALVTVAQSATDSGVEPHQPATVVSFSPTLDTAVYAAGDILFSTVAVALARANDKSLQLVSLTVIDKSKQHPAISLFFYETNVTSAAANAANNLSDADAINCLGYFSIAAADWKDLANNSFACYGGSKTPGLILKPATGTTNVYVVGVLDAGTPTFALADLMFQLGVVQG